MMLNCLSQIKKKLNRADSGPRTGPNVHLEPDSTFHNPERITFAGNNYVGPECLFFGFGGIEIGDGTIIAHRVEIMTRNHHYDSADLAALPYDTRFDLKSVTIGSNVWIASNVLIVPGITIGDGAVVAMGAVVTKDVPSCAVVGGNPAQVLRFRDREVYERLVKSGHVYMREKYGSYTSGELRH